MNERTVYFLSDQTGVTAETLGHSLITQFNCQDFRQVTLPFIDSEDKAREAVRKIDESDASDAFRPIVFSTLVQPQFRKILKDAKGLHLDIFDEFLAPLELELDEKPAYVSGRAHGMSDIDTYMKRIEATNFALANDDGGVSRNYEMADVTIRQDPDLPLPGIAIWCVCRELSAHRRRIRIREASGFPETTESQIIWTDDCAGPAQADTQGTSSDGQVLVSSTSALRVARIG